MAGDKTNQLIQKIDYIAQQVQREDTVHAEIKAEIAEVKQHLVKIDAQVSQISAIYPIVMDPKEGLVLKVHDLNQFRSASKKVGWALFTSVLAVAGALVIAALT